MRPSWIALAIGAAVGGGAGCNQIFGLDPVGDRDGATGDDAPGHDASGDDAPGDDAPSVDGPSSDRDGDGVLNASDNCPDAANAAQRNEDGDGFGDACDRCPLIADTGANSDGDGLGDACDPTPGNDCLAWFDTFAEDDLSRYRIDPDTARYGNWIIGAGTLRQQNAAATGALILTGIDLPNATVHTRARVTTLLPAGTDAGVTVDGYGIGVWNAASERGALPEPEGCLSGFQRPQATDSTTFVVTSSLGGTLTLQSMVSGGARLLANSTVSLTFSVDGGIYAAGGSIEGSTNGMLSASGTCARGGRVGLRTRFVLADFDYLLITRPCPGNSSCSCPAPVIP